MRVGPPYRNAAVAADPLGHVCEVMLEPSLPLGEHLPAPLVPVQRAKFILSVLGGVNISFGSGGHKFELGMGPDPDPVLDPANTAT
jgi:hypothetical protein